MHNAAVPPEELPTTNGDDAYSEDEDTSKPKSPLLTSHRLSTESLDNVNLEEESQTLPKVPEKGIIPLIIIGVLVERTSANFLASQR